MKRREFIVGLGATTVCVVATGCGNDSNLGILSPPFSAPSLQILGKVSDQDLFCFDNLDRPFVIKTATRQVQRLDDAGALVWSTGPRGRGPSDLDGPVALDSISQSEVWILDRSLARVARFTAQGTFLGLVGNGVLRLAQDLKFSDGLVFVSDSLRRSIVVFTSAGIVAREISSPDLIFPRGLALDPQQRIHVVSGGDAPVHVYSREGQFLSSYGSHGAGIGKFLHLRGLAIRASDGLIAAADPVEGDVEFFDSNLKALGNLVIPNLQPRRLDFSPQGQLLVLGDSL